MTASSPCELSDWCRSLFASLDRVEAILSKKRYLTGDRLTEADVRLFMTLIRFDEIYVVYFKTNRNFIHEFPNMSNYVKELYQTKGETFWRLTSLLCLYLYL